MTRFTFRAVGLAAALCTVAGLAVAQAPESAGPGAEARVQPVQFRGDRHGFGRGGILGAFGPRGAAELFEEADGNGDGALTQDEIDALLSTRLAEADGDGDGAVTLDEFAPVFFERVRPRMVDTFQALDEDGSGEITAAELEDRFGSVVARLDRDGDDALTLQDRRRRD